MTTNDRLPSVASLLWSADPHGMRLARALRSAIDDLLDGPSTGRLSWGELHKSERRNAAGVVEICLQREFGFPDGDGPCFSVGGANTVCAFSTSEGPWMTPPDKGNVIVLAAWADDAIGLCGLGAAEMQLKGRPTSVPTPAAISAQEVGETIWVHNNVQLPSNVLAQLSEIEEHRIRSKAPGQQRVNELFKVAQKRRISAAAIATVAMQKDYMKRVRYNGGARSNLRKDGIIILGDTPAHQRIASALGLLVPSDGDFISVRVALAAAGDPAAVELDGHWWRVANEDDVAREAPLLS